MLTATIALAACEKTNPFVDGKYDPNKTQVTIINKAIQSRLIDPDSFSQSEALKARSKFAVINGNIYALVIYKANNRGGNNTVGESVVRLTKDNKAEFYICDEGKSRRELEDLGNKILGLMILQVVEDGELERVKVILEKDINAGKYCRFQ